MATSPFSLCLRSWARLHRRNLKGAKFKQRISCVHQLTYQPARWTCASNRSADSPIEAMDSNEQASRILYTTVLHSLLQLQPIGSILGSVRCPER